jgi:hypothetical protein
VLGEQHLRETGHFDPRAEQDRGRNVVGAVYALDVTHPETLGVPIWSERYGCRTELERLPLVPTRSANGPVFAQSGRRVAP